MVAKPTLSFNDKEVDLYQWIYQMGEKVYPKVGEVTIRVPPVHFNAQKIENKGVQDGVVMKVPQASSVQTDYVENLVCTAFQRLSDEGLKQGKGSASFVICNFIYENYLNKLDLSSLPKDNGGPRLTNDVARRGELDIMVLHRDAGLLLVQTKAVGSRFQDTKKLEQNHIKDIVTATKKACIQLNRDHLVIKHVMNDLPLKEGQISVVLALPNLSRDKWIEACNSNENIREEIAKTPGLDPVESILCEEDFYVDPDKPGESSEKLKVWWGKRVGKKKSLDLFNMKTIAYRCVGLLSTVSIWTATKPRMEVRTLGGAAWETGNRFAQVMLSDNQMTSLARNDKYLYLCGPQGCGKTLLLSLKGQEWLQQNRTVIILNTRLGSNGREIGRVMAEAINKKQDTLKAHRVDLDLNKCETLSTKVSDLVSGADEQVHFLVDEVTWKEATEKMLEQLKRDYPKATIWCAGLLSALTPTEFEICRLQEILRCPPSVQRVLSVVDNRKARRSLYTVDSAMAGLPTDGPVPCIVIHSRHGPPEVLPYDCPKCADEVVKFLKKDLNMDGGHSDAGSMTCGERPGEPRNPCGRLHYSDAVFPVSFPLSWHRLNDCKNCYCISREALAQGMMLLGSSPFCNQLLSSGVPLKLEQAMNMADASQKAENKFVMCPLGLVHGLEYKVVMCMASACSLPEETAINLGIAEGKMEPKVKVKRTDFGDMLVRNKETGEWIDDNIDLDEEIADKFRMSTYVEGSPSDMIYSPHDAATAASVAAATAASVAAATAQVPTESSNKSWTETTASRKRQRNNVVDGDDGDDDDDDDVCRKCYAHKCVCRYFTKEELDAMLRLNTWAKMYVLMCASRCNSQLILIIP